MFISLVIFCIYIQFSIKQNLKSTIYYFFITSSLVILFFMLIIIFVFFFYLSSLNYFIWWVIHFGIKKNNKSIKKDVKESIYFPVNTHFPYAHSHNCQIDEFRVDLLFSCFFFFFSCVGERR